MSTEGKSGMPTWLKVVLIALSVIVVGFIALVGLGFLMYTSIVKNDPVSAQKTVEKIVTFKHPLSAEYTYQVGIDADIIGTKFGVIVHNPDKARFIVAAVSGADKTVTTQQIVDQLQKSGRRSFAVGKEATVKLGDQPLKYVVGKLGDSPSTELPLLVGAINLTQPQTHSVIFVESMEDPGTLDPKVTDEFLNNIQHVN